MHENNSNNKIIPYLRHVHIHEISLLFRENNILIDNKFINILTTRIKSIKVTKLLLTSTKIN